jgi:NADPH-dependent curcumin reductase
MTETAERIVLASRPVGEPTLDNFRLEELPIPQPGPGHMLLRTLWLSLDPYMRGRMSDAPSYAKPVGIGDVMEGGTVSEVVASNIPRFAKGDIVVGRTGWQTHALSDGASLQKVEPTRAPIQTALGVLGMPGMTAYMGLLEIGKPAAGETVVVAAGRGRLGCRPDRPDQGCPRRRHRGRMQVCDRGTRLRRLHRPPGTRSRYPSCRSLPKRY